MDPRVEEREKISAVFSGLHDLQLYANDYFVEHLLASAGSHGTPKATLDALQDRVKQLAFLHNKLRTLKAEQIPKEHETSSTQDGVAWGSLDIDAASRRLLTEISEFRRAQSTKKTSGMKTSCTYIILFS